MKRLFVCIFLVVSGLSLMDFVSLHLYSAWGFYAHQRINRLAVFTLPKELIGFYKNNIDFVTDNAVNPDERRYAIKEEAPRHFIDLDNYSDSLRRKMIFWSWAKAKESIPEDTLYKHGIVPWHIYFMKYQLTEAFRAKDIRKILIISADLGHYIADANVPLHTTKNYNGQLSNQHGIHGFWESRLPELFAENYDFFVGKAVYEEKVQERAWQAVLNANAALDSVLSFEKKLSKQYREDKKFGFDERNGQTVKTYSREFSAKYHELLQNQVERQMRASVKMVGDLWLTSWIDAGQPDLSKEKVYVKSKEDMDAEVLERKSWLNKIFEVRREADN